jgi:hypothetical protein
MQKRLLLVILLIPLVTASFNLGGESTNRYYSPGDSINGGINISFDDYLNSSIYGEGFEGGASLDEFLNSNGYDCEFSDKCSCFPSDCESYYSPGEISDGSFHLGLNEEKILVFKILGEVNRITGLSFDLNVENQETCINPLKIDLLNNNVSEWEANKFSEDYSCTYEGGRGCFDGGRRKFILGRLRIVRRLN